MKSQISTDGTVRRIEKETTWHFRITRVSNRAVDVDRNSCISANTNHTAGAGKNAGFARRGGTF